MRTKIGPFLARSEAAEATLEKASKVVLSKADARYWMQGERLQFHDSADYCARFMRDGRREWFSCGSSNKRAAAVKAVEIWTHLIARGMEATCAKYKPKGEKAAPVVAEITVGDVIHVAQSLSSARLQSLDAYITAWRCIVAEIAGIDGGKQERRAAIDAFPLSQVTPAAVVAWKAARLRTEGEDALAKRRAIVTVNSLLRNARALFARRLLPFLRQKLDWQGTMPFEGVALEKAPSARYTSRMDARQVLKAAREQLMEADTEAYKVIVLALVCGLRRSEIDHLLWAAVDLKRGVLRVESSKYHELKSEDSAGEIDLDPATVSWLKECRQKMPDGEFVIAGPASREARPRWGYRCDVTFQRVLQWLRGQGITGLRPLHTLRKEIGSLIAAEHGIFAASRYLRHSDIRMTASVYAAKKNAVTATALAGLVGG